MQVIRTFRYTMAVCGLLMLIGAVLVGIRLAPLSLRSQVAWGTLAPLVAAALTTVFESVLVVGTPLGFASASSQPSAECFSESASCSAMGRQWREWVWVAVLWWALSAAFGAYANIRLGAPGRVARGVVQGARAVCEKGAQRRVEPVPLIGARWICAPSTASRIEGELSKDGSVARYSARDLFVSVDLAHVDLTGLEISSPAARGRPSMHLVVEGARIHGAWPWAKATRMPGLWRAVYVASLSSALGSLAVALALRGRTGTRWIALAVGAAGGAVAWFALGIVDAHPNWAIASYVAVPMAAVAVMMAVSYLLRHHRAHWVLDHGIEGWIRLVLPWRRPPR